MLFLLIILLFFGCRTDSSNTGDNKEDRLIKSKELQLIKLLLDDIKPDELKNENFGVIISPSSSVFVPMNRISSDIIVWFKYSYNDKNITVNYFSFPTIEKINAPLYDIYGKQFDIFIEETIFNKKIVSIEDAKQLKIPLPVGLQNDILLNKMYDNKQPKKISIIDFYWGFKSKTIELIFNNYCCYGKFYEEIEYKILDPITTNIYYRETPEEWKEGYEKYSRKYGIDNTSLNEYLKEIGIIQ
jgi:hypothetical protein